MIQGEPKNNLGWENWGQPSWKKFNYSVSELIPNMYWFLELALVNLNIVIQMTEKNEQEYQLITW